MPPSSRQNGSLQLSPASQSLLKNQQIILNGTQQRIVVPKLNIRMETQTQGKINCAVLLAIIAFYVCVCVWWLEITHTQTQTRKNEKEFLSKYPKAQNVNGRFFIFFHQFTNVFGTKTKKKGFGLPPTPPSSLSSDDSEGNQSPEHSNSPMSPNVQQQLLQNQSQSASMSPNSRRASTIQQNSHTNPSNGGNGTANTAPSSAASARGYNGSSSRQPIHTPLISSQPVIYCVPYSVQICTSYVHSFHPRSVVRCRFCGTWTISSETKQQ